MGLKLCGAYLVKKVLILFDDYLAPVVVGVNNPATGLGADQVSGASPELRCAGRLN